MRTLFTPVFISSLLVCGAFVPPAKGVIFSANDILEVQFTVSTNLSRTPDVLSLDLGTNNVIQKMDSFSSTLFDGANNLGTHLFTWPISGTGLRSMNPVGSWVSSTSLFNFESPPIVTFTSIQNGTIAGRIDMQIIGGEMDLNLANVRLSLLQSTGSNGGISVSPNPNITSMQVTSVPEPATVFLLALGTGIIAIGRGSSGLIWNLRKLFSNSPVKLQH